MTFPNKTEFEFNHVGQPPYPQQTTLQTQENMDARAIELLTYINSVIEAYASSVTGDGGARNIGLESIVGVEGNDLQSAIASIKAMIDEMVIGAVPVGSVGADQLAFDPATQQELDSAIALITALSTALDTTNAAMVAHKEDYVRQAGQATSTGSANAYLIATTPALPVLTDGVNCYVRINANNTGASTLNWDGTGAKPIVDSKGVALVAGDLAANSIVEMKYNETLSSYQLIGYGYSNVFIKHSLATAVNDFLVASGQGVFVKKTLAEVKSILDLGSAAYTDSTDYASSSSQAVPAGIISMWSGLIAAIPTGWHLCDGTSGTPDLRDRFIVGAGTAYTIGNTGGENTHVLTTGEMPTHNHTASTNTTGSHTHTVSAVDYCSWGNATTGTYPLVANLNHSDITSSSNGSHSHTVTVNNNGSGTAHENRPPYFALAYIIKL